jgi:hypothetical protein
VYRISIQLLIRTQELHPLASTKNEIKKLREEVHRRLEKWRDLQAIHMISVKAMVLAQPPCPVEEEILYLPSDISQVDHEDLNLTGLAAEEANLREAQAHECILQLRLTVKVVGILHRKRRKHLRGQKQNTRARSRIQSTEAIRDRLLCIYNTSRECLVTLGRLDPNEKRLPSLTLADLSRKSTMDTRRINDTYRPEGRTV